MRLLFFYRDEGEDETHQETEVPSLEKINSNSEIASIKIFIEGMSCQSCVKNIEGTIGNRPGVINIKVNLDDKIGNVTYKISETTSKELIDAISDMGFDAFLSREDKNFNNDTSSKCNISNCRIHIDGMTCNSCVNSITGKTNFNTYF